MSGDRPQAEPGRRSDGYPPWREVARVATYLTAHRTRLKALAVQRCPNCPRKPLAEVHVVNGVRWAWLAGTRETPASLAAQGMDPADWPKVAPSVLPLDHWKHRHSLSACRGCRLTYLIDVDLLRAATDALPRETVILPAPERVLS